MPNKKKKAADWELEAPLDLAASLQELIDSPAFKEVSDEHGHSETAGTRIPTWMLRRIVKLREMAGSPYELMSDVIRDAIFVGLRVIHMRYKMSQDWDVETRMAAVVDATGASKRIKSQVDELISGLEEMDRDGDRTQAAERLSEYILAAIDLPSDWHKAKLFKMLHDDRTIKDLIQFCSREVQKLFEQGGS